jgi:serine/threonine-protein kinase
MALLPEPGAPFAGKYVIESKLGGGAAGVVFSAMHTELRERVAIKVLRDTGKVATERMIREARAAVTLQSEHVVRVMDVGRDEGGCAYLVMEQLDGTDLASLLKKRGSLPVAEAVDYVLQACAGVAEAHARGIVHRDLKPSNLFLTRRADGSPLVKVLDFGISKSSQGGEGDAEASLTGPADVLGSPMYMSPEQVRGAKNVDHRTDIWSLGVIVFRLVTGKGPFGTGMTVSAALASVVADEPEGLRAIVPDAPRELEAVVQRCLAKAPALRFASVAELAAALAPLGTEEGRTAVARLVRDRTAAPAQAPVAAAAKAETEAEKGTRWWAIAAAAIVLVAVPAVALGVLRHEKEEGMAATAASAAAASASATTTTTTTATATTTTTTTTTTTATATAITTATTTTTESASATTKVPVVHRPVARPRPATHSSVVRSAATDDRY